MKARRFDIFHLSLRDITTLRAYHRAGKDGAERISFTYEDSLKFTTVRKRNTQMFDTLYCIHKNNGNAVKYEADETIIQDFLYDAIIVEMRPDKGVRHAVCLTDDLKSVSRKVAGDLPEFLYREGFTITGVPTDRFYPTEAQREKPTAELKYVPFVASASMARQSEYMFVRLEIADALMERLSLGLLRMDKNGLPYASGVLKDDCRKNTKGKQKKKGYLSAAKISSYVGLALSDGQSIREMQAAWRSTYGDQAELPAVNLNAQSVICVKDFDDFRLGMEKVSSNAWKMHRFAIDRPVLTGSYVRKSSKLSQEDSALSKLFIQLSKSKTAAKTLKEALNDKAREEWIEAIDAVKPADFKAWSAEGVIPICMPKNARQIKTDLKRFAVPLAAVLCCEGKPHTFSLDTEEGRKDIKAGVAKLFDPIQTGKSNDEKYAPLKQLLKWIGLPEEDFQGYLAWQVKKESGGYRLILANEMNRNLLSSLQHVNEERANEESPLQRLCELFAMLDRRDRPDRDAAAFRAYIREHRKDLREVWKQALLEIEILPTGLHEKKLPVTSDLNALQKSIHGYAFLYAMVVYLKQEKGQDGVREYVIEKTDKDIGKTVEALCAAVDRLMNAPGKKNKLANALWNCVCGEAPNGEPEVISCMEISECDEDADEAQERTRVKIVLQSNTITPFMARLTPVLGGNLPEGAKESDYFENTCNFYDGCGFADDAFFDAIEKLMTGEQTSGKKYNAVILRLPWIKGLLIRLDWKKILLEKAGGEKNQIVDVFGRRRSLEDAHVLLAESMFKGQKQFSHIDETIDPWTFYWKQIQTYGFSLLIAGRNSAPSPTTRLNYQFLATNVMSTDALVKLVKSVLRDAVKLYAQPQKFVERFILAQKEIEQEQDVSEEETALGFEKKTNQTDYIDGNDSDDDDESIAPEDEELDEINETLVQMKLLSAKPRFANTKYMRKAMSGRLRALVLEMMRGQIPQIKGDVRFIVPDLDAMLTYISGLVVAGGEEPRITSKISSPINTPGERGMGRYYAPWPEGHKGTWLDKAGKGRDAVILRNPHLAAGEDALLMPLEGPDLERYNQYYGHLDGIAMISGSAFYTINGGDCDGDRASVVTQSEVVNAVRDSIEAVNAVVNNAIRHKAGLQAYLKEEWDKLRLKRDEGDEGYKTRMSDYLSGLSKLVDDLPDEPNRAAWCVCPPLIYAGSGAGGKLFSPSELAKGSYTLKNAFWKSYKLTTEQAIGVMSLNALDNAAAAYLKPVGKETRALLGWWKETEKSQQKTEPDMAAALYDYLRFWRVTNGALQTALEIDMAKTSVRPGVHLLQDALKDMDAEFFKALAQGGKQKKGKFSLFRAYRNSFVEKRTELTRMGQMKQFEAAVSQMLEDIRPKQMPLMCHPVDLLPFIVWQTWQNVKGGLPGSESMASFGELFRPKNARTDLSGAEETKKKMRSMLAQYSETIAERKALDTRRRMLATSYGACMRYMLQRYPMLEALERLSLMLPKDSSEKNYLQERLADYSGSLERMDEALQDEKTLARFVWETDRQKRIEAYKELGLHLCIAQDADGKADRIGEALLRHPSDIYLFKQYVKYLYQEDRIRAGKDVGADGIHTPAALRNALLSKSMREQAGDNDIHALLVEVCLDVLAEKNGWMTVEQAGKTGGRKKRVKGMSQFLMIQLLGDYLVEGLNPKPPKPVKQPKPLLDDNKKEKKPVPQEQIVPQEVAVQ